MIPGRGTKISHASGPKNQNIKKQKQYYTEFNKNFKNGPHEKSLTKTWMLRKILTTMDTVGAMEFLKDKINATKDNAEFFNSMNS